MEMQVDSQFLKEQRKKRAWSQSELAQMTGLSLRTVQRIEKNGIASLESVKAFAAVYELAPESFQIDTTSDSEPNAATSSPHPASNERVNFRLSDQAKQLSLGLFLPTTIVMLFMLFTKLPNTDWVHQLRLSLFSDSLPGAVTLLLNLTIALVPLAVLSIMVGICWDLLKGQGASEFVRQLFRHRHSFKNILSRIKAKLSRAALLLKKPALFSIALFILTVGAIGLTMEPYQKANLKQYITLLLQDDHSTS